MKKGVMALLVLAVSAVLASLVVVYIKTSATKDVNRALEGFYKDSGTSFEWYFTDWDGNKWVKGS